MNDYNAARKRKADHGLDWRFEWQRYVSRRLGSKATVLAVAGALAARARNDDGTAFLSSETMAAEIGKAENHTKDARAVLVDAGFLIDTGRTCRGCKVWLLAFPPVPLADAKAVAAEKRLHRRRVDLAGDPDLGSVHSGDPDLGSGQGPESRNAGTRISEAGDPNLGSHTGDGTRKGTGDGYRYDARERDSAPAVGPSYVAPLAEPRTEDEATADGSAAAGSGASAASPDTTTEARSADEENRVIEFVCETHGVELPCPDCEHLASQADLVAGPGRPAENGGTPVGHDPGAPRELSAAEAAVLAAVQKASPEAIIANDAAAAISRADAHDERGYLGALASLKLRGLIESRKSYPRDGGSLEEYFLPGCVPPLREGHDSAPLARSWADEPATPRTRGRGVVPEAPEPDMGFLSSFGQHDDSEDEDDMIDMFD